jgi:nucleoside 2-deoxyribosyltransferase
MKVYFAHPCFNDKQQAFKKTFLKNIRAALANAGLATDVIVVDPFDYTPNIECNTQTKLRMADEIKTRCLQLLDECSIVVALTDGDDTGTAFEAGYAHATNRPTILISETTCSTANAMLIGAAQAMIDNVLQDDQIGKLVGTIKSLKLH